MAARLLLFLLAIALIGAHVLVWFLVRAAAPVASESRGRLAPPPDDGPPLDASLGGVAELELASGTLERDFDLAGPTPPAPPAPLRTPAPPLPSGAAVAAEFGLYSPATCGCAVAVSADGVVGCDCSGCARWHAFCRGDAVAAAGCSLGPQRVHYQVLTSDLVDGLAAYFSEAATRAGLTQSTLLELGAGDGALAAALELRLAPRGMMVIATDRGDRALHTGAPAGGGVLLMDAAAALAAVRPDFVLACWMPPRVDWTAAARRVPGLRAYVLVGEPDGGACGLPWETWGVVPGGESESDSEACDESSDSEDNSCGHRPPPPPPRPPAPPYALDGFARRDLDLPPYACVCRTDERWCAARRSRAVVFEAVGHGSRSTSS